MMEKGSSSTAPNATARVKVHSPNLPEIPRGCQSSRSPPRGQEDVVPIRQGGEEGREELTQSC